MEFESLIVSLLFALVIFIALRILITINSKSQEHIKAELSTEFKEYVNKLLDEMNETNKKLMADFLESNKASQIEEKKPTRDLFATFVKLRNSIKDNCTKTMHSINAERIAIYLFHNGNQSTHGIKFFKISCICEKVNIGSGVREQAIDQSNIPINLFDETIDKLIDNGRCIIINDENIENSSNRIFISAKKIKYSQAVAIFDNDNNILGFVLVEISREYNKDSADNERAEIEKLIKQLVPILAYSDYTQTAIKAE